MKSQERHELETNALAKLLADWTQKIGPYSSHIVFGLLAIVAVMAIWQLSKSAWSGKSTEGWDRVTTTLVERNPDFDQLKVTGEEYSSQLEGQLAKLVVADNELYTASYDFLANKEQAMKAIGTAEKIYSDLAKEGNDSLIVERARLGEARVLELKGKVAEAIKVYESLEGPYAAMGKDRAEYLAKIPAEEYSTWLLDAQGAIPRRPAGLGGPMDFGADSLQMPQAGAAEQAPSGPLFGEGPLLDFESIQENSPEAPEGPRPDRYEGSPGETETPAGEGPAGEGAPAEPAPPAEPTEGAEPAADPADPAAAAPAGEGEQPATPEGN